MGDELKTTSFQLTRTRREEESASPVDPDSYSGFAGAGDQIRIAISIHIRHDEFDHQIACVQPFPAAHRREWERELGPSAQLDAIADAATAEIRARTLSLRGTCNQQCGDAAQHSDEQPVHGDDRFVDDAVTSQGSCEPNPPAIMQNPDSPVSAVSSLARVTMSRMRARRTPRKSMARGAVGYINDSTTTRECRRNCCGSRRIAINDDRPGAGSTATASWRSRSDNARRANDAAAGTATASDKFATVCRAAIGHSAAGAERLRIDL